jgi:hypothetical protein
MAGEPDAFGLKAIQHPVGESKARAARSIPRSINQ